MTDAAFFIAPETARIAIPATLAVCYASYHWWRWRMMHPKIDLDRMPAPAASVIPISARSAVAARQARLAADPYGTAQEAALAAGETPWDQRTKWQARREAEEEEARLDFEAFNPAVLQRVLRRASFRPECYVRLGEYSWYRGAMIETHFWLSMAKYRGVEGLDEWLDVIRKRWLQTGRPDEEENEYAQFTFQRGLIARAHLMCVSGFNAQVNHAIIVDLAQEGNKDAQYILSVIG